MSLHEKEQADESGVNVMKLFEYKLNLIESIPSSEVGPMEEFLGPSDHHEVQNCVSANLFPDQSMYVLDQQLSQLKSKLERLRFYLREIDDIIPC
jgi:hypothetical protein